MSIYLDSATPADASVAFALGFIAGITTNPDLITRSGLSRLDALAALLDFSEGRLFVQLEGDTPESRYAESLQLVELSPHRIGLKIPATTENFSLGARLASLGITFGFTAIFDPAQVVLACLTDAAYIFPYVNRSTRLMGDGLVLVRKMRDVIDAHHSHTQILAASIKSPDEAVSTILAGAHHITLPLDVITAMGEHPLSQQTIASFSQSA